MPDCSGAFDRSTRHHLIDLLFKDAVYDPREMVETFAHPESRRLEPLEGRAVPARDRECHGKPHNSIRGVLLPRGGISPVARRRSRLALTLAEREDISRGIASGLSI